MISAETGLFLACRISVRWPIYIINSVDKTIFFLDRPTTIVKHSINVHKDKVSPTKAKDTIMIKIIKFTLFRC